MNHHVSVCILFLLIGLTSSSVFAVDTIEPFSIGLSDVEMYAGFESQGIDASENTFSTSTGIGAGLSDRWSFFLGFSGDTTGALDNGQTIFDMTLFWNLFSQSNWALDLGTTISHAEGNGAFAPFFELNWDASPNQASWGLFAHGGPTGTGATGKVDWTFGLAAGGYITMMDGHQLLAEWAPEYDLGNDSSTQAWNNGSLRMGYNFVISDEVEIISEVGYILPYHLNDGAITSTIGFVASL
jgi:hypothetical protein